MVLLTKDTTHADKNIPVGNLPPLRFLGDLQKPGNHRIHEWNLGPRNISISVLKWEKSDKDPNLFSIIYQVPVLTSHQLYNY